MSINTLFTNQPQPNIHIGAMEINQLRDLQKSMLDEKEIERCPEASFLNNDKQQAYKVLFQSLSDTVSVKRRGRPLGSKNKTETKK